MQTVSNRMALACGLTAGVLGLGAALGACSSNSAAPTAGGLINTGDGAVNDGAAGSSNANPSADAGGGSETDAMSSVSTTPGSCANPTLAIDFSPMYSAFIPGSTAHTFQIPAVTDDGNAATWSVSDPTQAQLVAESFGGLPGVMLTVEGVGTGSTGQITVFATETGGACGSATLNITTNTENDWQIGNARYNNGVALTLGPTPGFDGGTVRPVGGGGFRTSDGGSFFERDGGTACTNCHGPTATNGPFKDVSHTPEQTGGFSDSDLIQIITQGNVPDGGYFDPTVLVPNCDGGARCTQQAYVEWHAFHQWSDITPDEYPGIVVYLRSLQPEEQNGSSNFGGGGRGRRDGGVRPRGPGSSDAGDLDSGELDAATLDAGPLDAGAPD